MNPELSIVVPIKNAETYLGQCLDSLVSQSLSCDEIEFVLVDDVSTDLSRKIMEEYAARDARFKVVEGEGRGLARARVCGYLHTRGKYIGWVDSDDFVSEDMFEKMLAEARNEQAELVMTDYDFFPEKVPTKEKWFKPYRGEVTPFFIERNTQMWNKIFARNLLERISFVRWMGYCSDGCCAFALIEARGIASIDQKMYHYRVGHLSMSSNHRDLRKFIENVELTRRQREFVVEGRLDEWIDYYDYRIIYSLLQVLVIASRVDNREVYFKYKLELEKMDFRSNRWLTSVLNENHGRLRSFVLRGIIPVGWRLSRCTTKLAYK